MVFNGEIKQFITLNTPVLLDSLLLISCWCLPSAKSNRKAASMRQ